MKNASQIITTIQYKPQYHKLLEHKCIDKLKSSLLLSVQNYIKYGYIKNNKLFFVISATLNKLDINNNINTIKMILNSPMILESEKFLECLDFQIDDVVFYVDHKPKQKLQLHQTHSADATYAERASGSLHVEMQDEKLQKLADEILNIIKATNDSN